MRSRASNSRPPVCCTRYCSLSSLLWSGKSSATRRPMWCAKPVPRRTSIGWRWVSAILVGPTCAKPSPPISRRRWRTPGRPWTGDRARWRTRQAGARRNYRMLSVVNDQRNRAVVAEIFRQLDRMTEARRSRLIAAEGAVPNVIWLVLVGGAAVTIAFTFFFGMESLFAQTVMTAVLALLIFSELLVVIAIDRPLTGAVKVHPTALAEVLADLESQPDEPR